MDTAQKLSAEAQALKDDYREVQSQAVQLVGRLGVLIDMAEDLAARGG